MPKETVQYGKKYWHLKYHATENTGAYWTTFPYEGHIDSPNGEMTPPADVPTGDEMALTRHPDLEVYWSRPNPEMIPLGEDSNGGVQIILNLDRFFLQDLASRLDSDPDISATGAITQNLTRYQINQLIKTLRRARNAAYGDDE